jgi:hypothetical protein
MLFSTFSGKVLNTISNIKQSAELGGSIEKLANYRGGQGL